MERRKVAMVYAPAPAIFAAFWACLFFVKPTLKNVSIGLAFWIAATLVFVLLVRRSIRKYGLVYPDKATWLRFVFDRWYMNIIFVLPGLMNKEWLLSAVLFAAIFPISFLTTPGIMNLTEGSRRRIDAYVRRLLETQTGKS